MTNVYLTRPKCFIDGMADLQNFIEDNQEKMTDNQVYELEKIYKNINESLGDIRKFLLKTMELDDVEGMKEYIDDLLDEKLFSLDIFE